MADNVPTCFNCQNKLVLDESVFECFGDQQNPFLVDVSAHLIYSNLFIATFATVLDILICRKFQYSGNANFLDINK